ncbi:MAG: 1,4-dihydroxy-2-naphthoate polyprenyltransferase [Clostridia bacterium]|nr:1,4-dihydroxy-2-naphthoate polyprenyltransferase [Clostridia bacterium]
MSTVALPRWQIWFRALRPWSFTASFIPVTLGTILAWQQGVFNLSLYILTVIGGILLHAGTNMVNTHYDFLNGVDTVDSALNDPTLVLGWMKPREVIRIGYVAFVLAALIGFYLTALRGWPLLILGLVGLFGGYSYTAGPAYKYHALGIPLVFLLMGPLMVLGAYVVQLGSFQLMPVLISLPVGFLVSGILHGNDLRDAEHDKHASIKTLSHLLDSNAGNFYIFLILGTYISLILIVMAGLLPWLALLPLITFPEGYKLIKMVKGAMAGNHDLLKPVEPLTARLHLTFGMLYIVGLFIAGVL